jgi:aminopeptidase N
MAALLMSALPLFAQSVFPVRDAGEARSRAFDVLHYRIEVAFDERQGTVLGKVTTTLVPFLPALKEIEFDAEQMRVHRVRSGGRDLPFEVRPKTLAITLERPASFRDTVTVVVEYTARPTRGLYFTRPDSAYPRRPRQIWTQGEDMDNHFWFPCYDFPNDRVTSEVLITVDEPLVAVSNGALVGVQEDRRARTRTYHWKQQKPHVSYLIMLAAGEYAVLKEQAGRLPLEYYVYPWHVDDARICFERTADMIAFFNKTIGFAYPWEKYAQVLIHEFVVGGMENTSATALLDNIAVYDARARLDDSPVSLIAHELAHQWWGDVVTCKDWRHLWLNESFASYFDPLYHEHLLGREEFDYQIYRNQQAGINVDRRLGRKPIVSVGSYGENVYPRGSAVLHMLRFVLGDTLFWRAIRHYITKHQFQSVETNDFNVAIEEATGQNLHWFFDQWVYRAGYPVFDVSYRFSDSAKSLALSIKQTQTVDSLTGIFRTPVDIEIRTAQETAAYSIHLISADTTVVLSSASPPELVIFDRGNWILKEVHFEKRNDEWQRQAERASHPVDRIRAIQALLPRADSVHLLPVLERLALADPFWGVRLEAIGALPKIRTRQNSDTVKQILLSAMADPRSAVRAAAVSNLGRFPDVDVRLVLRRALADSSYTVVTTALRSLARADSAGALPVLQASLSVPSGEDRIASAALGAIALVDTAAAIDAAFRFAAYGQPVPMRLESLRILRRYAHARPSIHDTIAALIADPLGPVRNAALRALGECGREADLPLLEAIAADAHDRSAPVAAESATKIRNRTGAP